MGWYLSWLRDCAENVCNGFSLQGVRVLCSTRVKKSQADDASVGHAKSLFMEFHREMSLGGGCGLNPSCEVFGELWVYLRVLNDVEAREDEGTDLGFE